MAKTGKKPRPWHPINERYGRWTAIEWRSAKALCRCDCGTIKEQWFTNLRQGTTTQCFDCSNRNKKPRTHGLAKDPAYTCWWKMIWRCEDPGFRQYHRYGGRGIAVCERWHDVTKFVEDMGPRPPGHTVERIDNDGNYEPSNCRWATRLEQAQNTSKTIKYAFRGDEITMSELARRVGMSSRTLRHRIVIKGMDVEDAVTEPLKRTYGSRPYIAPV